MSINTFQIPEFRTDRLILRSLQPDDQNRISLIRSDERVNRYIDRPKSFSTEEALQFILKINQGVNEGKWFYWAVVSKESEELIGTVCLWKFSDDRSSAEIGFELHPDYFNKGIMSEAVREIIGFAFSLPELRKIEAFTHQENISSAALLNRLRFSVDREIRKDLREGWVVYNLLKP
ncbi:MAG: N-acetyltransferase [Bacteroidetes bacterium]|nr:MAG: N-acetyltransferase [Bacteroidota bacterium]REK07567.1 MAG: N-acetyltransferase [Bacteroidota bacterium]REK37000.1 MAG: N-acetyltransferase [Bacteroidota bacterium]REK47821.1 MAG: N-acetyltransferase [Bacteroidota bacterium]